MSGVNPTAPPRMPNSATGGDEATTYKVNIDCAIRAQARLGWAFAPYAQDTPNMTVAIAAGAILDGTTLTEVAAQSTGTITAPVTHPRIDRVVIDAATGAASVVTGTEAASPVVPDLPSGKLPVARVALTVGITAITNAVISDERVGGSGGGVELAQTLLNPGADTAPSTQAVADELDDVRAMAMFHALVAQLSAARASGSIPGGYIWTFLSDELATKTNATYDSAGDHYVNGGGVGTKRTLTSGMLSMSGLGSWDPAAMINGNTGNEGSHVPSGAAAGAGYIIDHGSAVDVARIRIYREAVSAPYGWVAYYADSAGGPWTACTTATTLNVGWNNIDIPPVGSHRYTKFITTLTADGANQFIPEIEVYNRATPTNMTLIPAAITAGASPDAADCYMLHKAVDAVTLNTDVKLRLTCDDGSNWSGFATLAEVCQFDANYKVLRAQVETSALTGTSVKWELTTLNNKGQQIRAVGLLLR